MLEGQIFFLIEEFTACFETVNISLMKQSLKSVFPRMFMCKVECLDISVSVCEEQEYFISQLE